MIRPRLRSARPGWNLWWPIPRATGDRGSAGILTIAGGLVMVSATAVGGALVAGALVHHRAQSAADMVAIAGASRLLTTAPPCEAAAAVAERNQSRLLTCAARGARVSVTVAVPLPEVLRIVGREAAQASAAAELRFDPQQHSDPAG